MSADERQTVDETPAEHALWHIEDRLNWIEGKLRVLSALTEHFEDDGDDLDELSRRTRRDYFFELLREALGNQADQIKTLSSVAVAARAVGRAGT